MEFKRVVVTGLGTINPLGNSVETFWDGLQNGVSGAAPIQRFDASEYKTQFACEVKGFDPEVYVDKKEVRKHDPYTLYAFAAVAQAIEDSGLNLDTLDKDRAGVIWGAGIGGLQTFYEEAQSFDPSKAQVLSVFHPKNDCQYCRRTDFYPLWIQRTELSLRLQHAHRLLMQSSKR